MCNSIKTISIIHIISFIIRHRLDLINKQSEIKYFLSDKIIKRIDFSNRIWQIQIDIQIAINQLYFIQEMNWLIININNLLDTNDLPMYRINNEYLIRTISRIEIILSLLINKPLESPPLLHLLWHLMCPQWIQLLIIYKYLSLFICQLVYFFLVSVRVNNPITTFPKQSII